MMTKKKKYKNVKQVWKDLEQGKTIYWHNPLYSLTVEQANPLYHSNHFTLKDSKVLRITCTSNYFESIMSENDLVNLYS